jgi:hypothetical protein
MLIHWYLVTWAELDRARGPLDVEPARAEVAAVIAEQSDEQVVDYWMADCVSRVLVERYGAWTVGWCWAVDDGGLVSVQHPGVAYRLWRHSDCVILALQQWHATIEELAREFEALRPPDDAPIAEIVEFAAAALLDWVLERTHASDAWYLAFTNVLGWYLQAWAIDDPSVADELIDVVDGKFESWTVPSPAVVEATTAALGIAVAERYDGQPRDSTLVWIDTRRQAFRAASTQHHEYPAADGHRRFIDGIEHQRDPLRADRMREALAVCRESAFAAEPLDLALLARWNAILLGQPNSPTRTTDAYAKGGRERYGTAVGDETLIAYLAEANPIAGSSRSIRAARVYLDVCFFHPFADGNARTARLALDYVLAREQCGLYIAEPIFTLSRAANDVHGAERFTMVIDRLTVRLA